MASKIFFSHQKVYFWISAFDHRAIVLPKMHIVHWRAQDHGADLETPAQALGKSCI